MKDEKQEVNLTKVFDLVKRTGEDIKKLNRMEREVFFNAMNKANIIMDPELCDNIVGVAFKKKRPQIEQFMGSLKENLKEKIKKFRGIQDGK